VILGFRFVYGLRNMTPLVIGAMGFDPKRYFLLNAITAVVWATVIAGLGFAFGEAIERIFHNVRVYERSILLALAIIGSVMWAVLTIRRRIQIRRRPS
jgi:membrane protein DedA with SNARE-associated domain